MLTERPNPTEGPILCRQLTWPLKGFFSKKDRHKSFYGKEPHPWEVKIEKILKRQLPKDRLFSALFGKRETADNAYSFRCFTRELGKSTPVYEEYGGGRVIKYLGKTTYAEAVSNIFEYGYEKNPNKEGRSWSTAPEPLWTFFLPEGRGSVSFLLVYEGYPDLQELRDRLIGYVEVQWV